MRLSGEPESIKAFEELFLVFVLCFRSRIEKVNYRQKEKAVLDEILGHGYDKRIRPSGKNDTGTSNDYISYVCPLFIANFMPKYLYTFEN